MQCAPQPDCRWIKGFGLLSKLFHMTLGALIIKASLEPPDPELFEQDKENQYLQFFIGLERGSIRRLLDKEKGGWGWT